MRRSHEMEAAEYALECVKEAERSLGGNTADYVGRAKAAPAVVMDNGLLQTLAYYQEKGKGKSDKPEGLIADQLVRWLRRCGHIGEQEANPVLALTRLETPAYRRATSDALGFLSWVKRLGAGQIALKDQGGKR